MECAQISVTGGTGASTPSAVSFPGAYKQNDPGILINIYQTLTTYVIPGPTPFTCGGAQATTAASSTKATTSATTLVTTTKATTTSAVVSSTTSSSKAATSTAGGTVALYGQVRLKPYIGNDSLTNNFLSVVDLGTLGLRLVQVELARSATNITVSVCRRS